jgi:hypothetical protein
VPGLEDLQAPVSRHTEADVDGMEELMELRDLITQRRYPEALHLLAEMEEMSRDDKINRIGSFAEILLLHLIKQAAEHRTTRSWELSIRHAVYQIARTNRRRKAGGTYLEEAALREAIHEAYPLALERAALEAFEGKYDAQELGQQVDRTALEHDALTQILAGQEQKQREPSS